MSEEKPMPCAGNCQQGRIPCPTPQACQLPEEPPETSKPLLLILAIVIVCVLAIMAAV